MLKGMYLWPTASQRFFEANRASIRSQRSVDTYDITYRRLHRHFEPLKRVEQYTEADLVGYLNAGADPKTGKPWSPESVLRARTAIRSFFAWAAHEGLCRSNPADYLGRLIHPHRINTRDAEHHWLEEDEVLRVLATCDGAGLRQARDRVCLALGFFTGMRASEIADLRWSHVHRDYISVVDGKGGKSAQVPLVSQLSAVLTEWRTLFAEGLGAVPFQQSVLVGFKVYCAGGADLRLSERTEWVYWAKPVTKATVWNILVRRGADAGFPGLRPHDMRRTFAGILEDQGWPIQRISEALRHENVGTTQRYLAKNPRKLRDAMREFRIG